MPEQGDIVLIPIPFTDLSSHKRRPVIVITLSQSIVVKTFGRVNSPVLDRIRDIMQGLTAKTA